MTALKDALKAIKLNPDRDPKDVCREVADILLSYSYTVVIEDHGRPWGGFNQLANNDANRFIQEFFPGLSPEEARLGNPASELSPKVLVVAPGQRLSWQYHDRRAERWSFITDGGYFKSTDDNPGELILASSEDTVQFEKTERHRLVASKKHYTIVAEIWQHTDSANPSNEGDIVRLEDDYSRY